MTAIDNSLPKPKAYRLRLWACISILITTLDALEQYSTIRLPLRCTYIRRPTEDRKTEEKVA